MTVEARWEPDLSIDNANGIHIKGLANNAQNPVKIRTNVGVFFCIAQNIQRGFKRSSKRLLPFEKYTVSFGCAQKNCPVINKAIFGAQQK